jgi:pyruvate dehydrogenase E1 component alpha subunit
MLLADPGSGVLATDAIVGEGIGIATGAALALSLRNSDDVVVSYFGDGAVNEGIFHASLNIAALWRLPCVFVCENNHYAKSCSVDEMVAGGDLAKFADVHGIAGITIDGMDVFAVWEAARNAVTHARAGQGPTMIVADTYRFCGHSVGDTEIYRPKDEVEAWSLRDPVLTLERELLDAQLVDEDQLAALRERLANTIDAAETHALAAPGPDPATALAHVYWGG